MCAFGIIIGDTIPQVLRTAFPKLATVPILGWLAHRQFVIALCTLCVSYPLSLHRDIHKLARASGLALVGMCIVVGSVLVEGPHAPKELQGDPSKRWTILGPGIFQAVGVISFAFVCHHNVRWSFLCVKTAPDRGHGTRACSFTAASARQRLIALRR
jgi:solute carrier family 38 (sodium-coupled neutral amino acid transporter), member 11